jgi:N-acetylglucosamine-6-phosphate deacetylase
MPGFFTTFTNCRICVNGELLDGERFVISHDTGLILESTGFIGGEIVDLNDAIIAPGFLELHTNGVNGFHFTSFENKTQYHDKLEETARFYVTKGITGFWATVPTVSPENYQKVSDSCSFGLSHVFFQLHHTFALNIATILQLAAELRSI